MKRQRNTTQTTGPTYPPWAETKKKKEYDPKA